MLRFVFLPHLALKEREDRLELLVGEDRLQAFPNHGSTPHLPARKFFIDVRRSGWHDGQPGVPINLRASFMTILAVAWRPDFLNSSVSFLTFLCGEEERTRAFFFPVRPIALYLKFQLVTTGPRYGICIGYNYSFMVMIIDGSWYFWHGRFIIPF